LASNKTNTIVFFEGIHADIGAKSRFLKGIHDTSFKGFLLDRYIVAIDI
jgi:hypothetical protein